MTPKQLFDKVYNGQKNIMTPTILQHGTAGEYIWELSSGQGIFPGDMIYGVTVLRRTGPDTAERTPSTMNKCFGSKGLAEQYIRSLKGIPEGMASTEE
jgi:hypothetical protein